MRKLRAPGRRASVLLVLAVVAAGSGWLVLHTSSAVQAECNATAGSAVFTIDPEQATNATTIAAVAYRLGLPHHAVSVGLAAALQESKLRNLSYGDRDSLGLFQQRPSQGWGSPDELMTPTYAATAFFHALRRVHGWQTLPITEAAQRVQRSGAPAAYAVWDTESRTIARGLTGETPAGFMCVFPSVPKATASTGADLTTAASEALGQDAFGGDSSSTHGWLAASWLVTRARTYSVSRVSFAGWTWTPGAKGWRRDAHARPVGVTYSLR
jgi:hypothetical protein